MKQDQGWEAGAKWYDSIVGKEGHLYHQELIIPKLKELLPKNPFSLIDLGCGQGFLANHFPQAQYVGIDVSKTLIQTAKKAFPNKEFYEHDLTKPITNINKTFDIALFLLSLQDILEPSCALKQAFSLLKKGGKLILVLNHPLFRIPRQSSWGIDEEKNLQFRRIDRYMTPLKIPMQLAPSKGEKSKTVNHHHFSLSTLSEWLYSAGFTIEIIQEWVSNKMSQGKYAKRENRAREEFPLFMTVIASK